MKFVTYLFSVFYINLECVNKNILESTRRLMFFFLLNYEGLDQKIDMVKGMKYNYYLVWFGLELKIPSYPGIP